MELGAPDESGRARPVPIEGSEFVIPVDNVVLSIGNRPNPLLLQTTVGLKSNKWGCLVVEDESAQTSLRHRFMRIFAARWDGRFAPPDTATPLPGSQRGPFVSRVGVL
jgi:NADPH-dependent glutamate synthase beta subunit-like oxidoreductase